jgi:hypothetical protein
MNQVQFEARFTAIHEKLAHARGSYNFTAEEGIWGNIGANPLDIAFLELSELYLEADHIRKKYIFDAIASTSALYDIWYFVRRIGKQIKAASDHKWLEIGIAAAMIDGARTDYRDLIVSMVLLRFAAELHGIDPKPFFDQAIQNADETMMPILKNVRDHSQKDVRYTVRSFGDPEWVSQSFGTSA